MNSMRLDSELLVQDPARRILQLRRMIKKTYRIEREISSQAYRTVSTD